MRHNHLTNMNQLRVLFTNDRKCTNQPLNPAKLGFFSHTNSYNGTITDTGLTAFPHFGNGGLVNYSSRTGTLTDANISDGYQYTQFFTICSDPGGSSAPGGQLAGFYAALAFFGATRFLSSAG
jgi:hypothetical protein